MIKRYFIGVDEDEAISTLYHGGPESGHATAIEAYQQLDTYDEKMRSQFRVYRISVGRGAEEESQRLSRTWGESLRVNGYEDVDPTTMTLDERRSFYFVLYQALGEVLFAVADPHRDDEDRSFQEDIPGEWRLYNAAYHSVLAAMDAVSALEDVIAERTPPMDAA